MSEKRPPGCEHCTEKCTIHLTQIVGNQIVKVDLCDECPHAMKLQDPGQFELLDKILDLPRQSADEGSGTQCPVCGMSERRFRKENRFGCANCYTVFGEMLERTLAQLHRGVQHRGKVPRPYAHAARQARIHELRHLMSAAVKAEDFEAAARTRDEILRLESMASDDCPGKACAQ